MFLTGFRHFQNISTDEKKLLPVEDCGIIQIEAALARLQDIDPLTGKVLMNAASCTAAANGSLQRTEIELLRALSECLNVPIPEIVEPVKKKTQKVMVQSR
jgi:hypothetical protein